MVQANELATTPEPPERALVDALYTAVRRAHRLRRVGVHSACDKAGLVLLGQLAERGPMRLSELAAEVQLDVSTVSRQVRGLCEGGFAEALEDPEDRRARVLRVSDKGRDEVESVARELGEVLSLAVRRWPKRDLDQLTALLRRLADDIASGQDTDSRHAQPVASAPIARHVSTEENR